MEGRRGMNPNASRNDILHNRYLEGILIVIVVIIFFVSSIAQAAVLVIESFEDSNFNMRGWYDNYSQGTISLDGHDGKCLQWTWQSGQSKPVNGNAMRHKFNPTETIYIEFYQKLDFNWRGSQKTYHPHLMMILSNYDNDWQSPYYAYLNTYIEHLVDRVSPYIVRPGIRMQDNLRINTSNGPLPNDLTRLSSIRDVGGCNGTIGDKGTSADCYYDGADWLNMRYWTASSASILKGKWVKTAVWLKMNTINEGESYADGIMKMWIDGMLVLDNNNIEFRTAQDGSKKFAQFVMAPYIGDGSPIMQTMWIDELTISDEIPGVEQSPSPPKNLRIPQ